MTKFYPGDVVKVDLAKLKRQVGNKANPDFFSSLKEYGISGRKHGVYENSRKMPIWHKKKVAYITEGKILFPCKNQVVEVWVDSECLKMVKSAPRHPLTSIFVD